MNNTATALGTLSYTLNGVPARASIQIDVCPVTDEFGWIDGVDYDVNARLAVQSACFAIVRAGGSAFAWTEGADIASGWNIGFDITDADSLAIAGRTGAGCMKPPALDLSTVPDADLYAEVARRRAAKRVTRSGGRNGGRPITCTCGSCAKCVRRAKIAANRGV